MPNLGRSLVGYLVVLFGEALMSLATLNFLGFGAQPQLGLGTDGPGRPGSNRAGRTAALLVPGVAIATVVVAFNIVGVWISDRLGSGK